MTACSVPICLSVFPRECGCDAAASSKSSSSTTTTGSLTSGLIQIRRTPGAESQERTSMTLVNSEGTLCDFV